MVAGFYKQSLLYEFSSRDQYVASFLIAIKSFWLKLVYFTFKPKGISWAKVTTVYFWNSMILFGRVSILFRIMDRWLTHEHCQSIEVCSHIIRTDCSAWQKPSRNINQSNSFKAVYHIFCCNIRLTKQLTTSTVMKTQLSYDQQIIRVLQFIVSSFLVNNL